MDQPPNTFTISQYAKKAAQDLQVMSVEERNELLDKLYKALINKKDEILNANLLDIQQNNEQSLEARLLLTSEKFDSMTQGILDIISLPDPFVNHWCKELDDGLVLYKVACPIGVILAIFEARPEVVIQIASLCIKSGNACILKGGKESINTVKYFQEIITNLYQSVKPVQFVHSRESISSLITMEEVDLIIPRGSKSLVKHIQQNSTRPVLGHADGINSIFVDDSADVKMAIHCIIDAKTDYPAACNSVETLLIHRNWNPENTSLLFNALADAKVEIKASEDVLNKFPNSNLTLAIEADFDTEFLDLKIAVKYVNDVHDAISHIGIHGSKHTDCIISESKNNANLFLRSVDAAGVYWNCSTRFADGFRYGFGAEVGVSTNKIHARGPVGLEGLLIYKYLLKGNGQGASDYKKKSFKHIMLENKTFK
eukprot:NODE_229_length_12207_cov_1.116700.p3 type:complete len:427 gc:universal NODE_229_length_12207_cov_1.116700:3175-4455(+)